MAKDSDLGGMVILVCALTGIGSGLVIGGATRSVLAGIGLGILSAVAMLFFQGLIFGLSDSSRGGRR